MERMMGIEPTTAAWEAAVLPLNYIRTLRLLSYHKIFTFASGFYLNNFTFFRRNIIIMEIIAEVSLWITVG